MARYDYKCKSCGIMELEHSMSAPAVQECPKCNSKNFERVIHSSAGAGIHFKGSGFYKTDYRKGDGAFNKYLPDDPSEKKYY
jgi:putative FmdB family regulatory protein